MRESKSKQQKESKRESRSQTAGAKAQEPESKRQRARGRVCKRGGRKAYRERRATDRPKGKQTGETLWLQI